MAYGGGLASLLGGGGGPSPSPMGMPGAPSAALGAGMGAPPNLGPGMPPPPTGVGAMSSGDPSTSKKVAADSAVLALRELSGQIPALAPAINMLVDQIKAASAAPAPQAPPTSPMIPGAPPPAQSSLDLSGSPGGM
jgi:transcription elongation regulator 1